jgi:hypothetical protein
MTSQPRDGKSFQDERLSRLAISTAASSRISLGGIDLVETVVLPGATAAAACHEHLFDYPIPIAKIAAFMGES